MNFTITIDHNFKKLKFPVEQINVTRTTEQFRITAANKIIVIQSNRPALRNAGLKYKRPTWRLVEGELNYQSGFEDLCQAIMDVVEGK